MQLGDEQRKWLAYSMAAFGLGTAMLHRYRKNPHLINQASSYGMAGRALVVGTLMSVSTVGIGVILGSAYLGVNTVKKRTCF